MKKRIISFAAAMLLMLFVTGAVCAAETENNSSEVPNQEVLDSELNENAPTASLQFLFAKLQLEQSEIAKQQAMANMARISALQDEQRQVASFMNEARQAEAAAADSGTETMSSGMRDYLISNGYTFSAAQVDALNADEWNAVLLWLEARLNDLGTQVQLQMVYVQNSMAQYNMYTNTQGTAQTLTSLARGQSMYGDSEVGLAVTGLVVGLVLGCLITLAVQKRNGKKASV